MNLVIVESPTKSKTIEHYLGKDFTVRASMGHLRDLPKSTFGVDVEHNFEPKYINVRGRGDTIKELKTLAKKAEKIYLATDPDREGEAISWHLAHILGIDEHEQCRIVFNEITKDTVKTAVKNPRSIDMDMVDAQQARRILDRIVGYSLSPLLWRKLHIKGLSAGRVQSVAVKIVADRDAEIAAFIPQEYWTLNAKLRENAKAPIFTAEVVKYKGKKLEMHNAEEAQTVYKALAKADYSVLEAKKAERKRHPAPPFTTSNLQQEANKKLNFSSKKTMMLAQQLYEGVSMGRKGSVGLITYMRTDSVRLADEAIAEIRGYIENNLGTEFCAPKPNHYTTKKNAQDAHEAIRPTSAMRTPLEVAKYLSSDQLKLYTLIWNRAVACQMSDARFEQTSLVIGAGDYQLKATGSILTFKGFLELYGKYADEEKDSKVPYIAPGTALQLHKLEDAVQHFTEPPAHYTEASLIKELEDKGIGRPSTYAPTIATILNRNYVAKEGKKLLVTDLGLKTLGMLTDHFAGLINIPFSANMEGQLDEIAEHKITKEEVLQAFYTPFAKDLDKANVEIPVEIPEPEVSDVVCDKCGRLMVYKDGRFGRFLACPGFPDCRNAKPILVKIGVPCPKCHTGEVVERKTKTGKTFYGCERHPECDFTSWDKPLNETCAACGGVLSEHSFRGKVTKYCLNEGCVNARPLPKKSAEGKTSTKTIKNTKRKK